MNKTISAAEAYWNQRLVISGLKDRFTNISNGIGHSEHLGLKQWAQIGSFALEYQPDLILELGRGRGNSTCLFTEIAQIIPECKVLSLCLSKDFEEITLAQLLKDELVDQEWLNKLEYLRCDILDYNYKELLKPYKRILVFWDAHGYGIANCVLGEILPLVQTKDHYVIMHDMADIRYQPSMMKQYEGNKLWKSNDWTGPRILLGNVLSSVEQAVSIVDFTSRNSIDLMSSDHSFFTELSNNQIKTNELQQLLGQQFFSYYGQWFYFTLNNLSEQLTFPKYSVKDWLFETESHKKADEIFKQIITLDFIHFLMGNKDGKLIIFGVGDSGQLIVDCIDIFNKQYDANINIIAFLDNDSKKWGMQFKGEIVYKPEEYKRIKDYKIVIASHSFIQIQNQLLNMGIKASDIMKSINY